MLRHTRHCITHHWSAAAGRAGEKARKARRVMETFLLTVLPRFNSDQGFRENPGMHKNHAGPRISGESGRAQKPRAFKGAGLNRKNGEASCQSTTGDITAMETPYTLVQRVRRDVPVIRD